MRPNLTITAGLRYSLYSPPYEVNGLQVAPTISMGAVVRPARAQNMQTRHPVERRARSSPSISPGPKNGRQGLLRVGQEQLRAARRGGLDPHAERDSWAADRRDRMVVRGGYSKVFDRVGLGLATELRLRASRSACRRRSAARSAPPYETESGGPVRQHARRCRRPCRPRRPAGSRRRRRSAPASSRRASTTRSSRPRRTWPARSSAATSAADFTIEGGYVGRFGRDLLVRRDIAMPLNLVDTASGMDYFTAAQTMIRAAQAAGITGSSRASRPTAACRRCPYWENLFPARPAAG